MTPKLKHRQIQEIYYGEVLLGTIKVARDGRRVGIAQIAQKMRQLFPNLPNYLIGKHLNIKHGGSLHKMIGLSPRHYKRCKLCGKPLKTERDCIKTYRTGLCKACRKENKKYKCKAATTFTCLNCLTKFSRPNWVVRQRIKQSGKEPMFCKPSCYHQYMKIHHIEIGEKCTD